MLAVGIAPMLFLAAAPLGEAAALSSSIQRFNALAKEPLPSLDEDQLRALFRGEVVGIYREPRDGAHGGATGLLLSRQPRDRLWLGIRDPHVDSPDSLIEFRLARGEPPGEEHWYQLLRLPWPFGNRHWVVSTHNNVTLATASEGQCWERYWGLAVDGEARCLEAVRRGEVPGVCADDVAEAIYTPANHGGWALIVQPSGRTLLGFQVTTVAGGFIPDHLVARYAVLRMDDVLRGIEQAAADIHSHYTEGHDPLLGGDGQPLAPFPRPGAVAGGTAGRAPSQPAASSGPANR